MSLVDDFREFMTETVTIQPFVSNTGYKDTYGTGVDYPCEIQYKIVTITKADGSLAVSTAQIFLDGSVTVSERDKVIFYGQSPKIQRIERNREFGEAYDVILYT
jgi:hypothetical protein